MLKTRAFSGKLACRILLKLVLINYML